MSSIYLYIYLHLLFTQTHIYISNIENLKSFGTYPIPTKWLLNPEEKKKRKASDKAQKAKQEHGCGALLTSRIILDHFGSSGFIWAYLGHILGLQNGSLTCRRSKKQLRMLQRKWSRNMVVGHYWLVGSFWIIRIHLGIFAPYFRSTKW